MERYRIYHVQITSNESVDSQFLDRSNIFDDYRVNSDHAYDADTDSDCVIWGPDEHESGDDELLTLSSDSSGDEMHRLAWNDNAIECARKPYRSESRWTEYRKKKRNEIGCSGYSSLYYLFITILYRDKKSSNISPIQVPHQLLYLAGTKSWVTR